MNEYMGLINQVRSLPELIRNQYEDLERKTRSALSTPEIFKVMRVTLTGCGDSYARAVRIFDANMTLLLSSSSIVADLDGYHGFEPNNDVSFECGVAFGAGLKCIAFISDGRIMRERIPHRGSSNIDWAGNTIENFNMSANLMFGCCFNILEGDAISALSALA